MRHTFIVLAAMLLSVVQAAEPVFVIGRGNTPAESLRDAQRHAVITVAGRIAGAGTIADNYNLFEPIFADCAALITDTTFVDGPSLWKDENDRTAEYIVLAAAVAVDTDALEKRISAVEPEYTKEEGRYFLRYAGQEEADELAGELESLLQGFPDDYMTVSEVRDEYDADEEKLHIFFTVTVDEPKMAALIRRLDAFYPKLYTSPPRLLLDRAKHIGKDVYYQDRLKAEVPYERLEPERTREVRAVRADEESSPMELVLEVNNASTLITRRLFSYKAPKLQAYRDIYQKFLDAYVVIHVTGIDGDLVPRSRRNLRLPLPFHGVQVFAPRVEFSVYGDFGFIPRLAFNPFKAVGEYRQTFDIDEWSAGDIEEVIVELGWRPE